MDIALKPLYIGKVRKVYVLEIDSQCPTDDYFEHAATRNKMDFNQLMRRIKMVADLGNIRNETIFKKLRDDIYEFKTRHGLRLYCFCDADQLIVTVNGDDKGTGKGQNRAINQAVKWKNHYFQARKQNIKIQIQEL